MNPEVPKRLQKPGVQCPGIGKGKHPNTKANLKMWPKGVSGNPNGARAHDPVKKQVKKLTSKEVEQVIGLIMDNNIRGLKKIGKDPTSSVLKVWVASIAARAIHKGDSYALNMILDRAIGRVKEKFEISGEDGGPIQNAFLDMTAEERYAAIEKLRKNRNEIGND